MQIFRTNHRRINGYNQKEILAAFLFLLPNLTGFILFMLIPTIGSFIMGFSDWNLINSPSFAGLGNYRELLQDSLFWKTAGNTAVYVFVKVPLNLFLSLLLAILLNRQIMGRNFFRVITFLPMVCSSVSIALIWKPLMESSQQGLLNHFLGWFHLGPFPWISSMDWAMGSVIFVGIWKEIGYFMVIFLAGLQGISKAYYEAAEIDGAGPVWVFTHITFPLISPTTFFVFVTSIIGSFQIFDLTSVLTNGGPGNATNTMVMYIYQAGFRFFRMGYASALSYMLFIVIFAFTLFQNKASKKWVHYG